MADRSPSTPPPDLLSDDEPPGCVDAAEVVKALRVAGDFELAGRDTDATLGMDKETAGADLAFTKGRLDRLQQRLYAEQTRSVLVVLQAMDAAGKDGTIRSVLSGLNPQGIRVASFKVPTETELAHDYLWRVHAACPPRGHIGVFNRSHYEDVLVVRVHDLVPKRVWSRRFGHIRAFEEMLHNEGTTIVKLFLNVSKKEQAERLQERLDNPEKRWKFRADDVANRKRWDEYCEAYEEMIRETSTEHAPWYVLPADRNWVRNLAAAKILLHVLEELDPQLPPPEPGIRSAKVV